MNKLFPNQLWNYKNFNMGTELDIAGEFIYDGIKALNQMSVINQTSLLFSFLYHISVGLERLQKIVLVLYEDFDINNFDEFEKSLITHSHIELNSRIEKRTKLKVDSRTNDFLQLITSFYKKARYNRFNLRTQYHKEQQLVSDYIYKHIKPNEIEKHFLTKHLIISSVIKELFGRVIGSLSRKYYELIYNGCNKHQTFTYELQSGSKAEKVFLSSLSKNSLQEQYITERIVLKELIVYIKNSMNQTSFVRFLQDIEPLDLDIALLNVHIHELCQGTISQSLIDEVEYEYEENSYGKERIELIDLIGNLNVEFDSYDIHECYELLNNLMNGNIEAEYFAKNFPNKMKLIEDECMQEKLIGVPELCCNFLASGLPKNKNTEKFINEISQYYLKYKEFFKC